MNYDSKLILKKKIFEIFVNSKIINNFMSRKFVKQQKYIIKKLRRFIKLQLIDETKFNKITKKTNSLLIIIQRHHEKISFEIVQIITHDIVLKMF